jgi:hypothetical protein
MLFARLHGRTTPAFAGKTVPLRCVHTVALEGEGAVPRIKPPSA